MTDPERYVEPPDPRPIREFDEWEKERELIEERLVREQEAQNDAV